MTSKTGKQTIAMHILTNISKSTGNQIMKFGQSIEYTWKTFFWKNHTQNVVEKLSPDPLPKSQN